MDSENIDSCITEEKTCVKEDTQRKFSHLIFQYEKSSLSSVPYHADVSCITRYFSKEFPFHLAIHQVQSAKPSLRNYTELHIHECDEINMLVGEPGKLKYIIQLGDEIFEVDSCSAIWIPAGLPHSANVLEGVGYYVALRLHSQQSTGEDKTATALQQLHKHLSHIS